MWQASVKKKNKNLGYSFQACNLVILEHIFEKRIFPPFNDSEFYDFHCQGCISFCAAVGKPWVRL